MQLIHSVYSDILMSGMWIPRITAPCIDRPSVTDYISPSQSPLSLYLPWYWSTLYTSIYSICHNIYIYTHIYIYLSSTLPEIDPDTAYVVCISVSLGFRQKPSDTALLSVIALTTFNCIVSASVTKGVLVCFVVTVHWWRHRTHYDFTEAYRVLRNILTVDLNNGATRADLRGIPKHYEATAKAGR